MQREWLVDVVQRLPQGAVSRAWGWLARRQRPRVGVSLLKHAFVHAVGIDMSEAGAGIGSYRHLEALFVRKLRAGSRRIDPNPAAVVSPVDGTVGAHGVVTDGTIMQVKGRSYSVASLLDSEDEAARFEGGSYVTLYLAPRDYHRIHAPLSGEVRQGRLVPGALLPVFPEALQRVDGLFARNERIITYIDTPTAGRVALVKVGATLVGRISLAYDPDVWTNQPGQRTRQLNYDPPRLLQKGSEVGSFELGSTVVVVTEPGRVQLDLGRVGTPVKMGHCIGHVAAKSRSKGKPDGGTPTKSKAPPRRKTTGSAPARRRAPRKAP